MRILLCVSNFPYAAPTVKFAGLIATTLKAEISLLTVRQKGETPEVGQGVIQQATQLLPIPPVDKLICWGTPNQAIQKETRRVGYQLVVLGARDKTTLGELLLGTVSKAVVSRLRTSVLVVHHPPEQIRRILICTSGKVDSDPIVSVGRDLAKATHAKVTLLHVATPVPSMYAGLDRIDEDICELLQTGTPLARGLKSQAELLCGQGIDTQLELRHGLPAEEIIQAAKDWESDLIFVGRSAKAFTYIWYDQVSQEIVEGAPCPVWVVR